MNHAETGKPILLALMVGLDGLQGHQYDYGRTVQQAVSALGWDYRAAVPKSAMLETLPPNWSAALDRGDYRFTGNVARKLNSIWRLGQSARAAIKAASAGGQPVIVFVEFFNEVQLLSLLIAVWRMRRGAVTMWLVYRLPVHRGLRARIYQALMGALRLVLTAERIVLFTDSTLLVDPLSRLFRQVLRLLPVPHGAPALAGPMARPDWSAAPVRPRIVAWWPGRPTADKGLARIQQLAQATDPIARQAVLVLAQGAGLSASPDACGVRTLPDALTRPNYLGWLHEADLILLPYCAEVYGERTSGIFVEAIAAGKIAPVSAHTWMASEALAHGLPELIVEWDQPGIWQRLLLLAENHSLRPRLERMAEAYRREHNPEAFATALRRAWEGG